MITTEEIGLTRHKDDEEWIPFKECPHFLISNTGRLFNTNTKHERKLSRQGQGYLGFTLFRGTKSYGMHRQVAEHFCEKPITDESLNANHLDGNKHNNYYKNLRWDTYSQNAQHAIELGLAKRGEKRFGARLNELWVKVIRESAAHGHTHSNIARYFKVSPATISRAANRSKWKHVL